MFKDKINDKDRKKFDAYIGQSQDWWLYYSHYKVSLDELVKLVEVNLPINTISLPMLFLMRHGMELGLKANILRLQQVTDKPKLDFKSSQSHSLEYLYGLFVSHLEEITSKTKLDDLHLEQINGYKRNIQSLTAILHVMDKGSYNFRYPVDREGNLVFNWDERINIADVLNLYYEVQPFILFTEEVLEGYGVFFNVDKNQGNS